MKITKKTVVTIELDETDLMKLESEFRYLNSLIASGKKPNHRIVTEILEIILEE